MGFQLEDGKGRGFIAGVGGGGFGYPDIKRHTGNLDT